MPRTSVARYMRQGPQAALRALLFGLCFLWGEGGAGGGCAARASIRDRAREVERLWILWKVWTNRLARRTGEPKKAQKKEPTGEAAAPASVGSAGGNGLRLPFLCEQVIGCRAPQVEPHPSEPIE
jgi:hypothetical protein